MFLSDFEQNLAALHELVKTDPPVATEQARGMLETFLAYAPYPALIIHPCRVLMVHDRSLPQLPAAS